MLREGMFIADRYEVLEKIGSGGMSDVYKAKCHKLNRYVAIKVLKPEFSEDKNFVSKFRVEAQSAAGLMHANIVNVYDVGEENGVYYIVMELVEGITLKKYIEKKGRLGVRESVSIAIQVAQGIEAAHKHNIVHRDIKPQNIIISKEGKVKVTDFGIARAATSNTINSAVMGSVHYISPEQARGGYSDTKSDIYSFGIVLFEMLTGRVPFEGDTTVAVALQHIQDDMVSPREYLPDVPVSVEKIVLKCTQKKTERRYQDMGDVISDLKRSLVTPDEDFVVIAPAITSNAPTRMIAPDEVNEIVQRASVKSTDSLDVINPNSVHDDKFDADDEYEEIDVEETDDDEDDGYGKKTTKKIDKIITILGIAVAVVIIVITVIIISKMLKLFKKDNNSNSNNNNNNNNNQTEDSQGKIEVPNVLNYTVAEATEILNELGLGIKEVEEYSAEYEAGKIFAQSVEAGEMVDAHTQIIVTVSKGANSFALPDVVGMSQAEAEKTMKNKDLKYIFEYESTDDNSLIGTVAATDPIANTTVNSGDTIRITLYKGINQQNVIVPNLMGLTESDARKEIQENGFEIGEVTYKYDDSVPADEVIAQSGQDVGKEAPEGSVIGIVVSLGKPKVPNIVGMTEQEASTALEKVELKVGTVTKVNSDTVEAGKIISVDSHTVGDSVKVGTAVNYTVSLGVEEIKADYNVQLRLSQITGLIPNGTCDESKEVKIEYYVTYTDGNGGTVSDHKISTTKYDNFTLMGDSAPFNLNGTIEGAVAGNAQLKVVITYHLLPSGDTPTEGETSEGETSEGETVDSTLTNVTGTFDITLE